MKVCSFKKAKFLFSAIAIIMLLSVSVSYSVWDNTNFNAILAESSSGNYEEIYTITTDNNKNNIADVGDIISFGKYYQDDNTNTKTPIDWVVVEKKNNLLTLLAQKVMAFGSFWGIYQHDGSAWLNADISFYQNYSTSTLRAWLNSYYNLRADGGSALSQNSSEVKMRGFLSEAFNDCEQNYIVSKKMANMKGYGKDNIPSTRTELYAEINDKIWVPSWSEIYGTAMTPNYWNKPHDGNYNTYDGAPNEQFSYFKGFSYQDANEIFIAKTTAFASSSYSNYTDINAKSIANAQRSSAGSRVWWWLRSPRPTSYRDSLTVTTSGVGSYQSTDRADGGVRPAIIITAN